MNIQTFSSTIADYIQNEITPTLPGVFHKGAAMALVSVMRARPDVMGRLVSAYAPTLTMTGALDPQSGNVDPEILGLLATGFFGTAESFDLNLGPGLGKYSLTKSDADKFASYMNNIAQIEKRASDAT